MLRDGPVGGRLLSAATACGIAARRDEVLTSSDTPSSLLQSSTELRDLSLTPTCVRPAKITIIHPQLRDLVLPLERGRVLYPRGNGIDEQRWVTRAADEEDEVDEETGMRRSRIMGTTKSIVQLSYAPNCLTSNGNIFACGGQHGELYIAPLPRPAPLGSPSSSRESSRTRTAGTDGAGVGCALSVELPTRSINNSLVLLPAYPQEWRQRARERKLGFVGRGSRRWEEMEGQHAGSYDGRAWRRRSFSPCTAEEEEEDDALLEEAEDLEDDAMEIDEYDDIPSPSSSVATYPNTVPFLHARRIPYVGSSMLSVASDSYSRNARRASSGSTSLRPAPPVPISRFRPRVQSHSATGFPAPQIVSSRRPSASHILRQLESLPSDTTSVASSSMARDRRVKPRPPRESEPRILISNNDQSIKMFAMRSAASCGGTSSSYERNFLESRLDSSSATTTREPNADRRRWGRTDLDLYRIDRASTPGSSTSRLESRFGWHTVNANDSGSRVWDPSAFDTERAALEAELHRAQEELRRSSEDLRRRREEFERRVGMRVGGSLGRVQSSSPLGVGGRSQSRALDTGANPMERSVASLGQDSSASAHVNENKRLTKIGGARFKTPINHSSISPDLKTMVSVGDSTDVYLFDVIDGGREFRKIKVLNAGTDAGFSTAWSKDGRKFAVASQDGQVTVWDHRSSQPLAIFYTSSALPTTPSFTSDLHESRSSTLISSLTSSERYPLLIDPMTGDPRLGSSTSGREAARVVKFSPEGSDRDLMVFTEENSNLHIIDARTFHTHVVVPVPFSDSPSSVAAHGSMGSEAFPTLGNELRSLRGMRQGIDGGTYGIAGVGFDPTGNWLYSGTERTVVEWDVSRISRGDGSWAMA